MTTFQLKAEGKLVTDVYEGYKRYAVADDGRRFRLHYRGRTEVWVDEENGFWYRSLYEAYFRMNEKEFTGR